MILRFQPDIETLTQRNPTKEKWIYSFPYQQLIKEWIISKQFPYVRYYSDILHLMYDVCQENEGTFYIPGDGWTMFLKIISYFS